MSTTIESVAVVPVSNQVASLLSIGYLVLLVCLQIIFQSVLNAIATRPTSHTKPSLSRRLAHFLYHWQSLTDILTFVTLYTPVIGVLSLCHKYPIDACINRFAWIAISHFVVGVVCSIHYSPFAFHLQRHRLLQFHTYANILGSAFILVHVAMYLNQWVPVGEDFIYNVQFQRFIIQIGIAALAILVMMLVLSHPRFRRAAYHWFYLFHQVFFLIGCTCIVMHARGSIILILPLIALFLFHKLWTGVFLFKKLEYRISPVVKGCVVEIQFNALHLSHKLRPEHILYLAAKPVSTLHPFSPRLLPHSKTLTTTSTPTYTTLTQTNQPTVSIRIRQSGGMFTTDQLNSIIDHQVADQLYAFVPPAPYLPVRDFNQVVFIAGGIGITSVLAWLEHFCNPGFKTKRPGSMSNTTQPQYTSVQPVQNGTPKVIEVVWIVKRDSDLLIAPELSTNLDLLKAKLPALTNVSISVTRLGRPELNRVVPLLMAPPTIAFVVGPPSLVDEVRTLDREWWVHAEPYSW